MTWVELSIGEFCYIYDRRLDQQCKRLCRKSGQLFYKHKSGS